MIEGIFIPIRNNSCVHASGWGSYKVQDIGHHCKIIWFVSFVKELLNLTTLTLRLQYHSHSDEHCFNFCVQSRQRKFDPCISVQLEHNIWAGAQHFLLDYRHIHSLITGYSLGIKSVLGSAKTNQPALMIRVWWVHKKSFRKPCASTHLFTTWYIWCMYSAYFDAVCRGLVA